ncbi:uncharacterized protein LOC129233399, partial [Uloborus diversus]|uniref:uncharacterized protein LOC129233399 n=1 Tax=Uloborus diversus TaxID=327109 RepID=UPI00240A0562
MATPQSVLDDIAEFKRWKTVHTRKVTMLENNEKAMKERIKTLEYKVLCLEHKSDYVTEVSTTTYREVFDNDPEAYEAPAAPSAVDPEVVNLRNRRRKARDAARRKSDERLEQLKAATDDAQVVTSEIRAATSEAREAKEELVQATTEGVTTKSQIESASSDLRILLERIPVSTEGVTESAPYVDPTPPGAGNIDSTRRRLIFGDSSGESVAPAESDSTPKDKTPTTTAAPASEVPSSGSIDPSDTDSTPRACLFLAPALPTYATTAPLLSSSGSIDPSDTDSTPPATSSFLVPVSTIPAPTTAAPLMSTTSSVVFSKRDSTQPGSSSSVAPASHLRVVSSPKKVGSSSQGDPATPRRSPRLKEKAAKSPPVTPIKSPGMRRKSLD